jgi:hemolysin III
VADVDRQAEVIVDETGTTTGTGETVVSLSPPPTPTVATPAGALAPARPAGRAPTATVDRSQLPSWRGWIHAVAFALSIPLGVALLLLARPAEARAAAAVYVITLIVGFGTSAAYHRLARGPRAIRWMRRADHSSIYLLIAGTYTPICLLALPAPWGLPVLAVVWVGAIVGVILKLTAFDRTRVAGWALYLVLGWAAIIAAPALVRHLTPLEIALILAGGLIYTGGSIVLATGRPNPFPAVFGYHEVWHACTVLAGLCNFASIGLVVASA